MAGGERRVIRRLAEQILALSAEQLVELNRVLRQEGGEGVGVREPRRPSPPTDVVGVALDAEKGKATSDVEEEWPTPHNLPEDYWETAE